jgi:H+/Cl- antiporter ClcA
MMAARLPGYELTPAVAVGMGAAVVAILRLPLTAVVLSVMLTSKAGLGASPLVIVGVVVAYVLTAFLSAPGPADPAAPDAPRAEGADGGREGDLSSGRVAAAR